MNTIFETFDDHYEKADGPLETQCWLWTRSTNSKGYGKLLGPGGVLVLAHRLAYERAFGPIPEGMIIMHRCDVRPCVNPGHLRLGTVLGNNRDRAAKGRSHTTTKGRVPVTECRIERAKYIRDVYTPHHPEFGAAPLGKKFGLSPTTISNIAAGRTWKNI